MDGHFSTVINGAVTDVSALHVELEPLDPVASELMSTQISTIYSLQSMIEYDEDTNGFPWWLQLIAPCQIP